MNLTDISLTADNSEFVSEQLASGQYPTPSDVVNEALRQARVREAKKKLADLLMEGLNSGPGIEVTEEWRKEQRAKFLAKLPPGTCE
jgi:putative addiction module CopG family antidote